MIGKRGWNDKKGERIPRFTRNDRFWSDDNVVNNKELRREKLHQV